MNNGGAVPLLNLGIIRRVPIPHPKLEIQKRIISILSAYDDLIENNLRRIKLLEESARLLYREWFVNLRFPGHEHTRIVEGVPEGWERKSIPEIIEINPKEKIGRGKEVWAIPMACLSQDSTMISTEPMQRKTKHSGAKFRNGDVILPRITPCLENGKTALVQFLKDSKEVACGSTEYIILRGNKVSSVFTYYLARSHNFRGNAIKSMVGSSGRQRVQVSCFNDFYVPVPPTVLLKQFDQFALPNFQQIRIFESKNQKLKAARDLLLPRLMSGELTV
jgi:type I restriction enzyme S subunit